MKKISLITIWSLLPIFALADSTWIGNGSIMSNYKDNVSNKEENIYPFGVTIDETMLHPSVSNNVGFFQWLVNSNSCKRLKIYATTVDYKNFIYPEVNIVVGSWETREYDRTFENVQLPFVIGENNTKYPSEWFTNNRWLVIAVEIVDGTGSGHLYATWSMNKRQCVIYIWITVTLDGGYRWMGMVLLLSILQSILSFGAENLNPGDLGISSNGAFKWG